jgi:CheY-like chemotaxis protein
MKQRILVVDDEPGLTWMIKLTLEKTGRYEVRTENLGIKAIEAAREFKPDLILLDVLMPGMLGSEIAAQLEQDPDLRAIKVVFLTAVVSKEDVQRAHGQIGGHEFIAKPIGAEDLCRVVEAKLRR